MAKYQIDAMPPQASTEVIELLRGVETATIGHWRLWGFCDRRIQPMLRGTKIAGTAVTVQIAGPDSTLLHHAAGLLRPGDVLLVDRLGDDRYACWGGGVTVAVKASGAAGGVIDGPACDLEEVEASGLPLWSAGMAPITTRLYDLGGRMNVPVSIGGAVVMPGDVVLADESGVLVLPPAEAEADARRALTIQENAVERLRKVAAKEATLGALSGASAKVEAGRA